MPKSHKVLLSTFRNWRFQEIGPGNWDLKRRLRMEQFSYRRCSRSEIVLKYKEKTSYNMLLFPLMHYTNRSPCLRQTTFPVTLFSLLSKAPEELHIEPLPISNGNPCFL